MDSIQMSLHKKKKFRGRASNRLSMYPIWNQISHHFKVRTCNL